VSGDDGYSRKLVSLAPDTGVPTQVDIASVAGAVPWLEGLKKYVQEHLVPRTGSMTLSKNIGDLYFGGVSSAPGVYHKHNDYVKKVMDSYRDVARALDVAIDATNSIVKNYKDVEHNNAVNVAAVEKAFAGDDSGGGTTTTTAGSPANSSTSGSY
jgi:hypothetical protein